MSPYNTYTITTSVSDYFLTTEYTLTVDADSKTCFVSSSSHSVLRLVWKLWLPLLERSTFFFFSSYEIYTNKFDTIWWCSFSSKMKAIWIFQCFLVFILYLNAVNSAVEVENSVFRERAKKYCRKYAHNRLQSLGDCLEPHRKNICTQKLVFAALRIQVNITFLRNSRTLRCGAWLEYNIFCVCVCVFVSPLISLCRCYRFSFRNKSHVDYVYTGLTKKCLLRQERKYDYKKLMKISDFPGIQPKGFLVRLPFYVLAPRDAHIVFSKTEEPNWTRDYVYEICMYWRQRWHTATWV